MKRRTFIAGLGSAAALPLAARAQQGERVRRIGVLMAGDENDPEYNARLSAFTKALADLGWTDGRNVRMDLLWGRADINRIQTLAQELVGVQPDILVTDTTPGDRCRPAGDADHPDRLWEPRRPRCQRHHRAARPPEWEHYRLRQRGSAFNEALDHRAQRPIFQCHDCHKK